MLLTTGVSYVISVLTPISDSTDANPLICSCDWVPVRISIDAFEKLNVPSSFCNGVSLILGGVAELIFGKNTSDGTTENANNRPSYAFGGAINTIGQGNPVPILYGRLEVGSQVISAGISTQQVAI